MRAIALLLATVAPLAAANCGSHSAARPSAHRFETTVPVFAFDRAGRFLRGDLSSGEWKLLADRKFAMPPSVVLSPDRRWVSYSGALDDEKAQQYWLYDRQSGSDRLYLQHAAWGGSIPEFSPDGKWIAIYANYDQRWPNASGMGPYLVDVASARSSALANPSKLAVLSNHPSATVTWSKDGRELLFEMRSFPRGPQGKDEWEYFAYGVGERRLETIKGPLLTRGTFYRQNGETIARFEQVRPQWRTLYRSLVSPDGRWIAAMDPEHALNVTDKDGKATRVAAGQYDECLRGASIFINGWLDARHLVYKNAQSVLVFDAVTGRNAPLHPAGPLATYFW